MTKWIREFLRCPDCGSPLGFGENISCESCPPRQLAGKDLRPLADRFVEMTLNRRMALDIAATIKELNTSKPTVTYSGPTAIRDSRELMSEVSLRPPSAGRVLDLGCGPRDQAAPLEHLGFQYVGVDYSNNAADYLADAHSLPFADETFDCVFSYAVLEHLHNPFIAFAEVVRVLKPGGWLIGTVSQGEPFHDSFFHHTLWATLALTNAVPGMKLIRAWDSSDTIQSLSSMGRYPRAIKLLLSWVDRLNIALPWLAPRRAKWAEKEKEVDRLHRAGSICFSFTRV